MKGTPERRSPLPRSGGPQAVCDSAIDMTNQPMYIAFIPYSPFILLCTSLAMPCLNDDNAAAGYHAIGRLPYKWVFAGH